MRQRPNMWALATLAGAGLLAYLDHRFTTVLPMMRLCYVQTLLAAVSMGYVDGLVASGGAIVLLEITHVRIFTSEGSIASDRVSG
jgi:hypothetical protein